MGVTLKQIGEKAGVSESLVSYALNGKQRVSEETRERVRQAAAELGYTPQSGRAARTLAARRHGGIARTRVLALMLPLQATRAARVIDNPFFLPYLHGVELEATERDYDLFLCSMRKDGLPRLLQSGGADGLIGINVKLGTPEFQALEIPMLALGAEEKGSAALAPDDASGIEQAVEHLVGKGHRRIAYVGMHDHYAYGPPYNRLNAYRAALARNGLDGSLSLIDASVYYMEREEGGKAIDRLLGQDDSFSAVICYNDLLAMGAIDRLQALGRKVPDDVAVVGFDDFSVEIGYRPRLTSIAFDRLQMGHRAVEMICEYLEGTIPEPRLSRVQLFPTKLVQRDTT